MAFARSRSVPVQIMSSKHQPASSRSVRTNSSFQQEEEERQDVGSISRRLSKQANFNSKPISIHYAVNNKILAAFDSFYGRLLYRGAYAFGVQFAQVALLEIPKHGYYFAPKHQLERLENAKQALRVTEQLDYILQNHLEDEAEPEDWERIATLKALALDNQRDCQQQYQNDLDWEILRCVPSPPPTSVSESGLCGDIMDFVHIFCPVNNDVPIYNKKSVSVESTKRKESQEEELVEYDEDEFELIPSPPYLSRWNSSDTLQTKRDDLQRALVLSGVSPPPLKHDHVDIFDTPQPDTSQIKQQPTILTSLASQDLDVDGRKRSLNLIEIDALQLCYQEDFEELLYDGLVQISQINTYQGRLPGSINGCTVIAPLLCVHYFMADVASERSRFWRKSCDEMALRDQDIIHVIDDVTPAILPEVRLKLGLTKHALIIPQDVHDFLLDKELLSTEQFIAVVGGNILDDGHVDELYKNLMSFEHLKLAATFFFHEHVIAIVRMQQKGKGQVWFDVIDSLPNPATLCHLNVDPCPNEIPYACRIRCRSINALKATIRWFACSRFTDENKQYINAYSWDDNYSDVDPRVFQSFLWSETPS